MNGQMEHSVKSKMSKNFKTEKEMREANKKAVEEDNCCDFQTTSFSTTDTARTMTEVMKTNKADGGMYSWMYAEKYDEASWFRARTEFLQNKVWELEAKMKKMRNIAIQLGDDGFCMRCGRWDGTETWDGKGVCKSKTIDGVVVCQECDADMNECDACNVSMKNEGGCDCQIIACANCGDEGEKYNHHLCDDGKMRCDDCTYDGATDDEEEEEEDEESEDESEDEEYDGEIRKIDPARDFRDKNCDVCLNSLTGFRMHLCEGCDEEWRWSDKFDGYMKKDPNELMRRVGKQCQSSDCENKLKTEHECRALMCLSCIEQWRIHDEEEMKRYRGKQ